jgi:hypothetical protein
MFSPLMPPFSPFRCRLAAAIFACLIIFDAAFRFG